MLLNGQEIQPGETKNLIANVARLPSHTTIDISVTVSRAKEPGPVLLLMGGLHGDEINGVEIVRRMLDQGFNIPERGTTISIPIINIYGFIHFSRYVPDGKDVNRSFPGNKTGSLASRVAYYLMREIIPKIDYGLDFHTGGADRTNFPQLRCKMNDPVNKELAHVFQAPFLLHSDYRTKSLRWAASKKGKKILVYEGGESSRFDEYAIQEGVNGALRVMKHFGMRSEAPEASTPSKLIKKSSWIRARYSGLFQTLVKSGESVKKKQKLGYLTDPFGEFKEPIISPEDGHIIGIDNNPIMHAGDAVIHLGFT